MTAAYPPNDEPTSAERPDWSSSIKHVRDVRRANSTPVDLAMADHFREELLAAASDLGFDLTDERILHAFFGGYVAGTIRDEHVRSMWQAGLAALIPEDVR